MWENQRLFNKPGAHVIAVAWAAMFAYLSLQNNLFSLSTLFAVCVLFWMFGLVPSLRFGLPASESFASGLMSGIYSVAIFGCFIAISFLFVRSPIFLLSAMALVWVADIGAYFFGKAFGKRKLAPTISPGKSWEGAVGGGIAVLIFSGACIFLPVLHDSFPAKVFALQGLAVLVITMILISAASVVGDLFESSLKRRANMKDSSALLPGHGGVLDRIDALLPVMPLVALLTSVWKL
jgi:phosphatidate cytidylyltransferase